jgi:hypothetical protein
LMPGEHLGVSALAPLRAELSHRDGPGAKGRC